VDLEKEKEETDSDRTLSRSQPRRWLSVRSVVRGGARLIESELLDQMLGQV
jgi:hypothetical protein